MNNDTIFALSSGVGKSGVAVIRISGGDLHAAATDFTARTDITPRRAYFANLTDASGDLIDQCLIIYFAAPHSFTGEDVIEIHCHGAPAVIEKIFDFLAARGMRMATPGEFSRRAFYNNKMDLADVDGLAALLDAQTDRQRRRALRSMTGSDSKIYEDWRAQMVEISAYAAAMLDYDTDDLPANIGEKIVAQTRKLHTEIRTALSRYAAIRAVCSGFNIVLAGATNVGKSSLFNRMVGNARAIVSDIPGTTRDVVDATLDIDGYLVNLSDTAGLRETQDTIEQMGIQRTKSQIENADLIIRVYDENCPTHNAEANEIIVANKSDIKCSRENPGVIHVSAKTGDGMNELMNAIREKMHALLDTAESGVAVNARTRELLTAAADALGCALADGETNFDIFSENVRHAADAIGKILGVITTTEVLDTTFAQLCLGK